MTDPKLTPREPTPYGRCPICGAAAVSRERRLNGNDKCANGHTYPSASASAMHDASANCWCEPTVDYKDPDTGVAVYVHKSMQ